MTIVTGAGRGIGARDCAVVRGRGRQGRGQRSRRRRRWVGHLGRTRRGGCRGNQEKRGGTAIANFETVAEAVPASKIVKMAVEHLRKARRRGQQCRHFARRDLSPHEHRRLRIRDQGAFDGLVLRLACRRAPVPRAGKRLCSSTSPRLPASSAISARPITPPQNSASSVLFEIDCARHELRFKCRPNCVSPFAWSRLIGTITDRDPRGRKGTRRIKFEQMAPGKDRAGGAPSCSATPPKMSPGRSLRCA